MGPKKETKETVKKENGKISISIDDPLNTSTWRCVVVMAIERSSADLFIIKDFLQEATKELRREVKSLNFETHVLKVVNNFADGELPFKYALLLNFSSIFQEASEYVKDNRQIPTPLLATLVKALLFYMKEENLLRMEKKEAGPIDPIQAMAQRPARFGSVVDNKTKGNGLAGKNKKPEVGLKMTSSGIDKQDTKLLKRGECAKDNDCIDDAPLDGYFNLYVLLTGFYDPDLPLELIKAGVPLHGVLCVDASMLNRRRSSRVAGASSIFRLTEKFWDDFMENLWNPLQVPYFKETIFQVYTPMTVPSDSSKIKEFFYQEISFLLYDMSDLKKKHLEYLKHLKLINVEEPEEGEEEEKTLKDIYEEEIEEIPNDSVTPPVVLHFMIKAVCKKNGQSISLDGFSLKMSGYSTDTSSSMYSSLPPQQMIQSKFVIGDVSFSNIDITDVWSQIVDNNDHPYYRKLYSKIYRLDEEYDLIEKMNFYSQSKVEDTEKRKNDPFGCLENLRSCGENMAAALQTPDIFATCWKEIEEKETAQYCILPPVVDYCLYLLFTTKVFCPFDIHSEVTSSKTMTASKDYSDYSVQNSSNFRLIENLEEEMKKPHFTVTEGSRSVLKRIPYNVKNASRDFFCHAQYKTISPERIKASSAPEFHVKSKVSPVVSFVSDFLFPGGCPSDIKFNVYENLRGFLSEELFEGTNDFDFVEELTKDKLFLRQSEDRMSYNCVDHGYLSITDSIFVIFHTRKDSSNSLHESFNAVLKNEVGFRDFFEYTLDDEWDWFEEEEMKRNLSEISDKIPAIGVAKVYSDSDFWMTNSIKYQERLRLMSPSKNSVAKAQTEDAKDRRKSDKRNKSLILSTKDTSEFQLIPNEPEERHDFEGYDVSSGITVQFSGMSTTYYTGDCNVKVELIERLYGKQELGIHISENGHVLHVYSYVCPQPHALSPFTFHAVLRSGIIIAFGRRYLKTVEEIEELVESKITIGKSRKSSSEVTTLVKKTKLIEKEVEDEEFIYDMNLSLPNGLAVEVVRNVVTPCYIKQHYLGKTGQSLGIGDEKRRLILPNGNIIKIMRTGKVEILKPDASIITADLDDLVQKNPGSESQEGMEEEGEDAKMLESEFTFRKYEILTRDGYLCVFVEGKLISSTRCSVLKNTDMSSKTVYFRRTDGTNFMLENDGTLTVQFKDGTKTLMTQYSSSCSKGEETESDEEEVPIVHTKTTIEHPSYATVVYNTEDKKWKILLPFETEVTVETEGTYFVKIDAETELKVEEKVICMSRDCSKKNFWCRAKVDLTVFENRSGSENHSGNENHSENENSFSHGGSPENEIYCEVKDSEEKTFVVKNNSNCYVLHDEEDDSFRTDNSELDVVRSGPKFNSKRELSRSNKYYVGRRDTTGFEILHKEDVKKTLTDLKMGSVVFRHEIPGSENLRCFVLISPAPEKKDKNKWEVDTIIPNPTYVPRGKIAETSSTYGNAPTWMHPFPKRRKKLKIPQELTCRVFLECNRTELMPPLGSLECVFCEMEEKAEDAKVELDATNIQDFVRKLLNDDQDILRNMYALVAKSILDEKKISAPRNPEKLEKYLALSQKQLELQEYHKKAIRYHLVPNYFESAVGICSLLLDELVNNFTVAPTEKKSPLKVMEVITTPPQSSTSSEIEYNLEWPSEPSYSDLSYRSGISMETAPTVLTRGGICKCKVRAPQTSASAPVVYKIDQKLIDNEESELTEYPHWACHFQEDQIEMLTIKDFKEKRNTYLLTLQDLMNLGLF